MTSGFAIWNAAFQASWAAPWEVAPMPFSVPDRVDAEASPPSAGASLEAQEESARAVTAASAAALPRREIFT